MGSGSGHSTPSTTPVPSPPHQPVSGIYLGTTLLILLRIPDPLADQANMTFLNLDVAEEESESEYESR